MKTKQRNRIQPGVRTKFDTKMTRLIVPLAIKAESVDQAARTFEGLASTWDEDLGADVIHKGSFKKSITDWKGSGEAMPLLDSHDHFTIFAAIGQAIAMKETDAGLWTKWEVLDGPDGDRVMQRLRPSKTTGRPLIGKMSIGFMPTKFDFEQPEGTTGFWDRIRHINEADLKEVSLVLFPMNPNASIDAGTVKMWLKAAHDTDPRTLDGLTRKELRRLNSKIGLLLKKQEPEDDEDLDDSEDEEELTSSTLNDSDSDDEATSTDEDGEDESDDDSTESTEETEKEAVAEEPKEPEPKQYLFGEALQTRLRSTLLNSKLSSVKQ